jgi:hypothetical protein
MVDLKTSTQFGELLTTGQAAKEFGIAESTLRKWRCYGRGPRFTRLGRAIRYRRGELAAFLDRATFESTLEADRR